MRRKGRVIRKEIEVKKYGKTIKLVVYKKATNPQAPSGIRNRRR